MQDIIPLMGLNNSQYFVFAIFAQEWTDSNMRWDESEYGGVKDIRVPPSSLWKPDILMYNR